jgi:hypothetical protein
VWYVVCGVYLGLCLFLCLYLCKTQVFVLRQVLMSKSAFYVVKVLGGGAAEFPTVSWKKVGKTEAWRTALDRAMWV